MNPRTRVWYLAALLALTSAWGLHHFLQEQDLYEGLPFPVPQPPPLLEAGPRPTFTELVDGLKYPVDLASPRDGSGRLFVVEQAGVIRIIDRDGKLRPTPFLDMRKRVDWGGEKGLLGLCFHPRYAENGRFFINYTRAQRRQLQTVVAELRVSDDPDRAVDEEKELLVFDQPWANHNGGQVLFGPDGLLYIGVGDGGSGNDPLGSGQDTKSLLGKLLRIDVDRQDEGRAYAIPPDNPFARAGGRPEIYAWGMRNPWRFSWDRADPDRLFVGDIGQNLWEEVHLVAKGDNCGWNIMEGTHCFKPRKGCKQEGLNIPICDYGRNEGQSVTGGFVYRGKKIPALQGLYVFCDYYPGELWGLREKDGKWERLRLGRHEFLVSSFGEDEEGELYLCDHQGGKVWRLDPPAKEFH